MPRLEEADEYDGSLPPPPFNDVPLVSQETPEQRLFVEAYQAVGRPRIVVFVNRTLQGELLPVNDADPYVSVERNRTSRGDVTVESRNRQYSDDFRGGRDDRDATEKFESRGGPGEFRDRVDVYLRPGQYDEVLARQVDYEAIENIVTDVLACQGRIEIVSPIAARRRLTESQIKDLQSGQGEALNDVSEALDADVLVHVTARPTRQTRSGLHVRLVAEAINSRGGQSIGRGVVDMPPPLDKPKINRFSRFLARKLMDGMIGAWESMPPAGEDDGANRGPRRAADEGDPDADRGAPLAPRSTGAPFADPPPTAGELQPPADSGRDGAPDDAAAPAPEPESRPTDDPPAAPEADEDAAPALEADAAN